MSKILLNTVKSEYNAMLFQVKPTLGDIMVPGRRCRKIAQRTMPAGYYMTPTVLSKDYVAPDKMNCIEKFFRRIIDEYRELRKNV